MRINELLTESQLQQIDEGPKLDAAGRAIGGVVSGAAKGLGALAGGVRGAFTALKKGYQTGKAIVGDDPDPNAGAPGYTAPADPKAAPAPVADPKAAPTPTPVADPKAAPTPSTTTPPSAADINAQGPEGSAPAKPQTGDAGKALAKTDAVTDKQTTTKAGETVYAQVKANIDKLDKKGKQRILQLLTKSLSAPVAPPVKTPAPKPAAADPAAAPAAGAPAAADPAAAPAAGAPAAADPGAAAFGQMANTLTKEPTKAATPAAAPAAGAPTADPAAAGGKLTAAQQAAKVAELKGKRAAGKTTGTTGSGFGGYVKKASGERVVGANKDGSVRTVNIKASKDNYGNALSEALALRVEAHKQKMFETGLARGTVSVFRK